ncbi:putative penicillin-binding protein [Stipitochalara longipes BDJ]|nr:putative penicillin-binding protein [Stipitochalara longipes BDJ]
MKTYHFFIWTCSVLPIRASAVLINQIPRTAPTLLGPIYLPPTNSSWQALSDASIQAQNAILQALQLGLSDYGPIDNQTTSFSASVFSATTNETLFEYHFEAPGLNGSYTKGNLTENTIYRTGSLGKLFMVYLFLVDIGEGVFLDPVTDYVPELYEAAQTQPDDPIRFVNWNEVTVGSMASQLSGIGRDCNLPLFSQTCEIATNSISAVYLGDFALGGMGTPSTSLAVEDGFPPLPNGSLPTCSFYSYTLPSCTRAQFFQGLINHPPAFKSYTTPMYSNLNYALLGLVYENITGTTVEEGWNKLYHSKLNMLSSSYVYPGLDADAIIPHNDSWAVFSYSLGIQAPAGGEYTSLKDLNTWGQAILQSTQLSKLATRRWLKPTSFTAGWTSNVGIPFELYRLPITADFSNNITRIVDVYTKSGDIGQYSTFFGVVPDHDIAISVLAAGESPNNAISAIRDTLMEIYVNAIEAAAKDQASQSFTGTFSSSNINSSITLSVDTGPGVLITSWISNSSNFLSQSSPFFPGSNLRLYPTNLVSPPDANGTIFRAYRAVLANSRVPGTTGLWPETNDWWLEVDSTDYDDQPMDGFVIGFGEDGMVQTVSNDALRVVLEKVDD